MKASIQTVVDVFVKIFHKHENQLDVYIPENDKETILRNLRFVEQVFPHSGLTLFPVSHPSFTYFSKNCEHILGHDHQKLVGMDMSDFFALIHPEDLPYVSQCFAFIKSQEPFDPNTHRFSIYYRLMNDCGKYAYIKVDNISIQTENNTYLYLMLFNNISDEERFVQVKLEVYRNFMGKLVKITTYNPKQDGKEITPRQNDIARLITKGFTNQEIADRLNLSIYTIKNHKQMLFKKANVKNSIGLASYVRQSLT